MLYIRKAYTAIDEEKIRRPIRTINNQPSMTKQSFAKELEVNNIIKKYNKTGILQKAHDFEALYGEFDQYDLREAIDKVEQAKSLFMEVPSEFRAKFDNDPGKFIDYATNVENLAELQKYGLAEKHPEPPPNEPIEVVIKDTKKPE